VSHIRAEIHGAHKPRQVARLSVLGGKEEKRLERTGCLLCTRFAYYLCS